MPMVAECVPCLAVAAADRAVVPWGGEMVGLYVVPHVGGVHRGVVAHRTQPPGPLGAPLHHQTLYTL